MVRFETIRGTSCEVALRREMTGYKYTVKRVAGTLKVLVCQGWTAGTQAEGFAEARDHACRTLAQRAG